jgi:hypothetical protein
MNHSKYKRMNRWQGLHAIKGESRNAMRACELPEMGGTNSHSAWVVAPQHDADTGLVRLSVTH